MREREREREREICVFYIRQKPTMYKQSHNIKWHWSDEHTSSRPITEVKQLWVQSVLGWVTVWDV